MALVPLVVNLCRSGLAGTGNPTRQVPPSSSSLFAALVPLGHLVVAGATEPGRDGLEGNGSHMGASPGRHKEKPRRPSSTTPEIASER